MIIIIIIIIWEEWKDITPWDHNNYTPPTATKKSASRIENVIPPKKIPKKSQDFLNEKEVVDLVQTQNDKGYAIKNAPKISHWDMK